MHDTIDGIFSPRIERLIHDTLKQLNLNLSGITVLTEAASGYFALTPIIAALAGADVIAVYKDTKYATSNEILALFDNLLTRLNIGSKVRLTDDKYLNSETVNIVTNLGNVRPIDERLVSKLPKDSVVALMWEAWELRVEDIDKEACQRYSVPIIATNEQWDHMHIFKYLGLLVLKMLFEINVEVNRSNILLISSDPFNGYINSALSSIGGVVKCMSIEQIASLPAKDLNQYIANSDAVVLAEHNNYSCEPGENFYESLGASDVNFIHLCGQINPDLLREHNINCYPRIHTNSGYMSLTLAHLGPRPVIELHALGLKLGEIFTNGQREGLTHERLLKEVTSLGYGMAVNV